MKLIIPMFLISATTFASAPTCDRLKAIAQSLERRLADQNIGNCKGLSQDESLKLLSGKEKELASSEDGKKAFAEYQCDNLATVDLRLRQLENELALLKGIQQLKTDIAANLRTVKMDPAEAKAAALSFRKNLAIASGFERLLYTETKKKKHFLESFLQDYQTTPDLATFKTEFSKFCSQVEDKAGTLCEEGVEISESVFQELKEAIELMRKGGKLSRQVSNLKEAMKITVSGKVSSFSAMAATVDIDDNGKLSSESIQVIQTLPNFSDDPSSSFVSKLKAGLNADKKKLLSVAVTAKFGNLMDELVNRNNFEMGSKLSVVLLKHEALLDADLRSKCDKAKVLKDKQAVSDCLSPLRQKLATSSDGGVIDRLQKLIEGGIDYNADLEQRKATCAVDGNLPPECHQAVDAQLATVTAQAAALRGLRQLMLSGQRELLTMRNLALQNLVDGTCALESANTSVGECYNDMGTISREATVLLDASLKISALFEEAPNKKELDGYCAKPTTKNFANELCELTKAPPKTSGNTEYVSPPVGPDSQNSGANQLAIAAAMVTQSVRNFLTPQQQWGNSVPYSYFPPMNQYPARPMTISEQGFASAPTLGLYQSTPGALPYTSIHPYSQLQSNNSFYFRSSDN